MSTKNLKIHETEVHVPEAGAWKEDRSCQPQTEADQRVKRPYVFNDLLEDLRLEQSELH